ncbi:MAG: hypothetical protein AABX89_01870 [Candidatus Thermoplasmatota archaeon]
MAMRELVERLAQAFERAGWTISLDTELEGKSGQVHAVPLLAEWDGQAIVLDAIESATLEMEQVEAFAAAVTDAGADRGILAHAGTGRPHFGPVVVWDRATLTQLLGELALSDAVGGSVVLPLDPDEPAERADVPVAAEPEQFTMPPAFLEPESPLPPPPPPPPRTAPPAPTGPFGSLLASLPAQPAPAVPYAPVAPRVAAAPAFTPFAMGRAMMPVRLLVPEAQARVAERLFGVERVELILQPVHLFDYEVDQLKEGSLAYDTLEGQFQVNASDKAARDTDPDLTNPNAPTRLPASHGHAITERVVRVTPERAQELAWQFVAKKHTRVVEQRVHDSRNSLYYSERKKVEPTRDQVRITPLGVVLRPVWRLWGGNGHVDVDAVDGTIGWAETVRGHSDAMVLD